MKILNTVDSRIVAIIVESEEKSPMVMIPPDKDACEESVELEFEEFIGVVPFIYRAKFSLIKWLQLTEQMYQGLKQQAGWKEHEAKQILPRGWCNGDMQG